MKLNLEETTNDAGSNAESSFANRCLASCRKLLAQIKSARSDIVAEFRDRLDEHQHMLELAVNEAEALAWQTGFPQLLFPVLAMEKAHAVATWHERQRLLQRRDSPLAMAA